MTHFVRNGNRFQQASNKAMDLYDKLPAGTYTIKINPQTHEFYYEIVEGFEIPSRVYGDLTKNTDRIINSFYDRTSSTGVLLAGEKGSGKTLLAKNLSVELIKADIPTIVVNTPLCGESFNTFVQTMEQPAVILFDEFEKVYDEKEQEALLTLLDGVYPTKKLFILTCNDKWRIDKHMRNRPGRIYYMLEFNGLSVEFVEQYATENLNDKTKVGGVVNLAGLFDKFNFDMLKAVVEEMNRYNETAAEAIAILNTKPEGAGRNTFTLELTEGGVVVDAERFNSEYVGNPLSEAFFVYLQSEEVDEEGEEGDYEQLSFTSEDIVTVDGIKGKFVFKRDEFVLTVTRKKPPSYGYGHLL